MKKTIYHSTAILLASLVVQAAQASDPANAALKVRLQAAMQSHIERSTIEGAYTFFSLDQGKISRFYPSKAHVMTLKSNGYYVLCSEFRNDKGENTPVDFYLVPKDKGFQVIRTEINNRSPLEKLMKAGSVSEFN